MFWVEVSWVLGARRVCARVLIGSRRVSGAALLSGALHRSPSSATQCDPLRWRFYAGLTKQQRGSATIFLRFAKL